MKHIHYCILLLVMIMLVVDFLNFDFTTKIICDNWYIFITDLSLMGPSILN